MSVKILGGILKGHALKVQAQKSLRPTAVMLRRKIFDAHQDLSNQKFIDLCAGTGAIGLEAWSRGAQEVLLVEVTPSAGRALKKNISAIQERFSEQAVRRPLKVVQDDCLTVLKSLPSLTDPETIIFLDPPYHNKELYLAVLSLLTQKGFIGKLWLEADEKEGQQVAFWEQNLDGVAAMGRCYQSGSRYISIFHFGL